MQDVVFLFSISLQAAPETYDDQTEQEISFRYCLIFGLHVNKNHDNGLKILNRAFIKTYRFV